MAEFTGERIIPGEVGEDLLNEHLARYVYARRLAGGARVLDAGCGTGYGTAELAAVAFEVTGIDIAPAAVAHAREHYRLPNVRFEQASCEAIPAADGAFDLVVAFEVIEHLNGWREFLRETRRVLAPDGRFVVSTPNRSYYAESRGPHGRNPFHVHEFDLEEFRSALQAVFPRVSMYFENHTEAIVFEPENALAAEAHIAAQGTGEPHFFLAICGSAFPGFVYVPRAGNLLRERERHIQLLAGELKTKNEWLERCEAEHSELVDLFRRQNAELEERNRWAESLDAHIADLRTELEGEQERGRRVVAAYEAKVGELEDDIQVKTKWALERDAELLKCIEYLHTAERTVEERTHWALRVQAEADELSRQVGLYRASRWVRVGNKLNLGPVVSGGK